LWVREKVAGDSIIPDETAMSASDFLWISNVVYRTYPGPGPSYPQAMEIIPFSILARGNYARVILRAAQRRVTASRPRW
jgi:hypothetical protein